MKKLMMILLLAVFFTACQKEDIVPQNEFADQSADAESDDSDDDIYDDTTGDDSDDASPDGESGLSNYKVSGNSITLIKDYEVSEGLKSYQDDKERHQLMWEHIKNLLPIEARNNIAEFEVFFGGDDLAGYVAPLDYGDLSRWKFAIAIDLEGDLKDLSFENFYTYVSLHEFGHILTLNDTQIDLKDESDCTNYFPGEGCSASNSYINRIYELGWADIID